MEYFRYINTPDPSTCITLQESELAPIPESTEFKQWNAPSEGWIGMRATTFEVDALEVQFKITSGQYPCFLASSIHSDGTSTTEGFGFIQKVSKGQTLYFLRRKANNASIFFYRNKNP